MKVYVINLVSESGDRETLVFKEKPTEEQLKTVFRSFDYDPEDPGCGEYDTWMHIENESWITVE